MYEHKRMTNPHEPVLHTVELESIGFRIQSNPVIPPTPPITREKRSYQSAVYKCTEVCPVIPPPAIRHPPTHRLVHFYSKAL